MASLAWSFLMLLLVIALIPGSLWLVKRMQQIRPRGDVAPRAMEVLSQLSLGPRERLVTVRVADRVLVLGVTAHSVALVTHLEDGLQ